MKVIGYIYLFGINEFNVLVDIDIEKFSVLGWDLFVKISVIVVNLVDYKICYCVNFNGGDFKILGWDVVGEIVDIGVDVIEFVVGDRVYYVGDFIRVGLNVEF